jgi:plastocyanin
MSRTRMLIGAAIVLGLLAAGCGKGKSGGPSGVGGTVLELNSGTIGSSGTYPHRFFAAGTYAYHCSIHTSMTGAVVVTSAATDTVAAVNIAGFAFSPATATIKVGGKVTWTNGDATNHTVTSD